MNTYEITELGQIREQESMLERAQSQALRRARDTEPGAGRLTRPRPTLRRRLAGLLATPRPATHQHRGRSGVASEPVCR